jgi:hypothetical protein
MTLEVSLRPKEEVDKTDASSSDQYAYGLLTFSTVTLLLLLLLLELVPCISNKSFGGYGSRPATRSLSSMKLEQSGKRSRTRILFARCITSPRDSLLVVGTRVRGTGSFQIHGTVLPAVANVKTFYRIVHSSFPHFFRYQEFLLDRGTEVWEHMSSQ